MSHGGAHLGLDPACLLVLTVKLVKCTTVDKKRYRNVPAANFDITYSQVLNNCPPRLLIFQKFSNPPLLFQPPPPFINFLKNEMVINKISE